MSAIRRFADGDGGATIFVKDVPDPERFGVVVYGEDGSVADVVEKAGTVDTRYDAPPTRDAVVGLYCFDAAVFEYIRDLHPSARGEFEITDVNVEYLRRGTLQMEILGRGMAWLDTGTHESLHDASTFIETIEKRQGLKIACPEEVAYRMGYIDGEQVRRLAAPLRQSAYGQYLLHMLDDRVAGPFHRT